MTTLAEPGGTDDFMSAAAKANLLPIAPLLSHRNPFITPTSQRISQRPFGPTDTFTEPSELPAELSAPDKGGQTWRLHKQPPCSRLDCTDTGGFLSEERQTAKTTSRIPQTLTDVLRTDTGSAR